MGQYTAFVSQSRWTMRAVFTLTRIERFFPPDSGAEISTTLRKV